MITQAIDTAKSLQRVKNYLERFEQGKGYYKERIHSFIDKNGDEIPLLVADLKVLMEQVTTTSTNTDAPVELPKPVGWFHRHHKECKNGEVCNYQLAPADKKYGWEEFPLYTEQQVHALLTGVPTPAAYADIKDAARYRWLRDNDWRNDEKMEPVIRLQLNAIWDEKIDAAMATQAGEAAMTYDEIKTAWDVQTDENNQ